MARPRPSLLFIAFSALLVAATGLTLGPRAALAKDEPVARSAAATAPTPYQRFMVGWRPGTHPDQRQTAHEQYGGVVLRSLRNTAIEVIGVPYGQNVQTVAARYAADQAVAVPALR